MAAFARVLKDKVNQLEEQIPRLITKWPQSMVKASSHFAGNCASKKRSSKLRSISSYDIRPSPHRQVIQKASIPLGWRTDRSWKWTPRPLKRTEGCLELGSHFASGNSRARLAESSTNGDPLPLWSCLVKHSSPCRSYSLPATWNAQASSPRMAWHQNLRVPC